MSAFPLAMDFVEFHEGKLSDRPNDRGGYTAYGISSRSFPKDKFPGFWADPTPEKAKILYEKHFFNANMLYKLPDHIAVVAFDLFVQHRPRTAVKVLQRGAGNLLIDGKMGKKTRSRLNERVSIPRIIQHRLELYDAIVRKDSSQAEFIGGWRWRSACLSIYATCLREGVRVKPNGDSLESTNEINISSVS